VEIDKFKYVASHHITLSGNAPLYSHTAKFGFNQIVTKDGWSSDSRALLFLLTRHAATRLLCRLIDRWTLYCSSTQTSIVTHTQG